MHTQRDEQVSIHAEMISERQGNKAEDEQKGFYEKRLPIPWLLRISRNLPPFPELKFLSYFSYLI
jgi:hypothetical protein